jgi:hypothetical protein
MPAEPQLFIRPDGRAASRAHLLVIPSVVCSNAVCSKIAAQVAGAVAVTHQHGCAQVGDDAVQTSAALAQLARHPNAWASLIVSLGCETLQGSNLASNLQAEGIPCALVGIQAEGGSSAAATAGTQALNSFQPPPENREPQSQGVHIGLAYAGPHQDLAHRYAQALRTSGLAVVGPVDASAAPVLTSVELSLAHGALAIVLVGDRLTSAPVLTPLLAVATDSARFEDSEGDFDLLCPSDADLVDAVCAALSGKPTVSEHRGDASFSLRRTLVTL